MLRKNNKFEGHTHVDFRTYLKSQKSKQRGADIKTDTQDNRIENLETNLCLCGQMNLNKYINTAKYRNNNLLNI